MISILPKADRVVIPIEKFTMYVLNPECDKDKAIAFARALGYSLNNWAALIEDIRDNITNFPATIKPDLGHGQRYEIIMELTGPNGKTASVLTAWIDDKRNGEMRLMNAYVDKRKGANLWLNYITK